MMPYFDVATGNNISRFPKISEESKRLLDRELAMSNQDSPFRQDSIEPSCWMNEQEHKRVMRLLGRENEKVKASFAKEEMMDAYESYLNGREKHLYEMQEERWKWVARFRALLDQPQFKTKPLAGYDTALYEVTFKSQPTKYISRARFLIVMRLVYDFPIAELDRVSDCDILKFLNRLYSSFDPLNEDKMDWRSFLFMIRVGVDFVDTPSDHLEWGFALYGSDGSMDLDNPVDVRLRDILDLLVSLTLRPLRKKLEAIFDETCLQLIQRDKQIRKLIEQTQLSGLPPLETKISFKDLKRLMKCPPLAPLLEPSLRHGPPERGPWTYMIEEKYYHPMAVAHIWVQRREHRNIVQCDIFKSRSDLRTKRKLVKVWWKYVWRRCRARYLCEAMVARFVARSCNDSIIRWRFWAMAPICATDIQRVFRGYCGRLDAKVKRRLIQAAVSMQSAYRGRICKVKFQAYKARREWAAIEIQRHVRGCLARRLAYIRLVTYVDDRIFKIARERDIMQSYPRELAAVRIQTAWRRYWGIKTYRNERARLERARIVEEAQRQVDLEAQRRRLIYMREVDMYYDKLRKETNQRLIDEKRVEEVKFELRQRKRWKKYQDEAQRKKEQKKLEAYQEEQKEKEFKVYWAEEKVKRVEAAKKTLLKKLQDPDNDSEREEAKAFEKAVRVRMPKVRKTMDKKGLKLEMPQIQSLAMDEIMDEMCESERLVVVKEMRQAAEQFEAQRILMVKKKEDEEIAAAERARQKAALSIQLTLYRPWKARKRVKELTKRRYRKKFDPVSQRCFYENIKTEAVQWTKPKVLGLYEDLEMRDEWYEVRPSDTSTAETTQGSFEGIPVFHYNPRTIRNQWVPPLCAIMCETCNTMFSKKRRSSDRKHYCLECWEKVHHDDTDRYTIAWKPVDGGYAYAKDTSIELIPDKYDIDPLALQADAKAAYQAQLLEYEEAQAQAALEYDQLYGQQTTANLLLQEGTDVGEGTYHEGGEVLENENDAAIVEMPTCQKCQNMIASRWCHECYNYYCSVCSLSSHPRRHPVLKTHTIQILETGQLIPAYDLFTLLAKPAGAVAVATSSSSATITADSPAPVPAS